MIKNERELAVTRSWIERFEAAASKMGREAEKGGGDGLLAPERAGLLNKAAEMRHDVAEYEALRSGSVPDTGAASPEELPEMLIKARIGLGMTQRELAERAGTSERQIREYERTDYESAGYARLLEVRAALSSGARPRKGGKGGPDVDRALSRAAAAGLEAWFVDRCIVGRRCGRGEGAAGDAVYERRLLTRLGAIYGWPPESILGSAPLAVGPVRARLRLPAGADRAAANVHAAYAGHMAGVLARASRSALRPAGRPGRDDPRRLRGHLLERGGGTITLPLLVEHAWDAGIAVGHLPPLAFHAAYFNREGAGAIVLSRGEATESRLMLDLARGLHHAAGGRDIVDAEGAEESEADRFARAVVLGPGGDSASGARAGGAQGMQEEENMPGWRTVVTSAIGSHADFAGLSDSDYGLLFDVMGIGL